LICNFVFAITRQIQKLVEVTTNQRRNIRRHLEKEAFDTMALAQTAGPVVTQVCHLALSALSSVKFPPVLTFLSHV
jgi:hypothetical protein